MRSTGGRPAVDAPRADSTEPDRPDTGAPAVRATRPARRAALYALPVLAWMAVWIWWPLAETVRLSFFDWNLTDVDRTFVGLDNYAAIGGQPEVWQAARTTGLYIIGLAPLAVVLPMLAAILLWKRGGRAAGVYRTLLFVPALVPPVVGAVTWQWIFHPLLGLANAVLRLVGVGDVAWLTRPATALFVVILVTGWKVFGLSFILFSAGLATIDRGYLDAARIDGAREWEVTRHVVVPLLRPTTVFVTFLCIVFASQWSFTAIDVLTRAGPAGATNNVFYLLYQFGFRYFDSGAASALAVLLVAAFGLLAAAQLRVGRRAEGT